ncbi:protein translocase subunit SecF [Candidatus Falkowbacteria bacterium]|nr:protein translocase subunit SecF [Candidatus Falkowbacteria bacterium]
MLNIMGKRVLWLSIAAAITVISFILFLIWGLNLGIDFTGGSLLELKFLKERPTVSTLQDAVRELKLEGDFLVQPTGEQGALLRFQQTDEATHQKLVSQLQDKFGKDNLREERYESIGPSIGKELKTKAIYAIILALIAIVAYVAWAFRKVSWPVASWKYGLVAIIALIHDILLPIGVFAVLGKYWGIEIGLPFVAALLTILGYSVNDTIVVFDRVRENLGRLSKIEFADLVNRSVNETLARSLNTTITTLLALVAVAFLGGESVRYFAIALIIGIASGAYSSIFIASPLLIVWQEWKNK